MFVCDTMLGKLARWLRILGYDTVYANESDNGLMMIAKGEERILLTRDEELAGRSGGFLIKKSSVDDQLKELLDAGLIEVKENRMLTRCPLCNSVLEPVDKESVRGRVPERSFENSDRFWYCEHCDKYYWVGKHWTDIKERVERIRR